MNKDTFFQGWYFKHNGEICGPISAWRLKQLLEAGHVQPEQAVWKQTNQCLLYVKAATIAVDHQDDVAQACAIRASAKQ